MAALARERNIRTVQQHNNTIMKDSTEPATPTTQVIRIKRITPNIFWMQGR